MPSITQAVEDYLKAIWRLGHDGGERVSVGDIAQELRVAAPSVTNMVRKLKAMRLLNYERYGGVALTPRGRKIALEIVRHHRLWELYLYMRLGVPLELVDSEAERLEHVLSDDMEELLTRNLGDPTHDPHGDPIPTKSGALAPVKGVALSQLEKGTRAIVARVSDRNPDKLRYIVALGLLPGTPIEVKARAPFRGPLTVRIGGRSRQVDAGLASLVIVRGVAGHSGVRTRGASRARDRAPARARTNGRKRK
jgi:DtxR family Mn-dependent transcriptional regulator